MVTRHARLAFKGFYSQLSHGCVLTLNEIIFEKELGNHYVPDIVVMQGSQPVVEAKAEAHMSPEFQGLTDHRAGSLCQRASVTM